MTFCIETGVLADHNQMYYMAMNVTNGLLALHETQFPGDLHWVQKLSLPLKDKMHLVPGLADNLSNCRIRLQMDPGHLASGLVTVDARMRCIPLLKLGYNKKEPVQVMYTVITDFWDISAAMQDLQERVHRMV